MIGWILRAFAVGALFLGIHGACALVGAGVPWWGSLLAAIGAYVACAFALKALCFRLLTAPFKAKGAALRGARLVVHSVASIAVPVRQRQPAMAGAGGGDDCEDDGCSGDDAVGDDWKWYSVDATVTPPALGGGPFRAWEPGELMVVSFDADTSPQAPVSDGMATVRGVEVLEEDGGFAPDEGMKYGGERRLRFTLACHPSLRVAKLRYYFEGFGRIELPQG